MDNEVPALRDKLSFLPRLKKLLYFEQLANPHKSGAQVVFKSFLQPLLAKQFLQSGSASANLRAKADAVGGDKTL
jgi:hypothetical protein